MASALSIFQAHVWESFKNAPFLLGSGMTLRSGAVVRVYFLICFTFYLTESVYKVVLQKSSPAQVRQLILYISNDKE